MVSMENLDGPLLPVGYCYGCGQEHERPQPSKVYADTDPEHLSYPFCNHDSLAGVVPPSDVAQLMCQECSEWVATEDIPKTLPCGFTPEYVSTTFGDVLTACGHWLSPSLLVPIPSDVNPHPRNPKNGDKLYVRYDRTFRGFLGFEVVWKDRSVERSWYSAIETLPYRFRKRARKVKQESKVIPPEVLVTVNQNRQTATLKELARWKRVLGEVPWLEQVVPIPEDDSPGTVEHRGRKRRDKCPLGHDPEVWVIDAKGYGRCRVCEGLRQKRVRGRKAVNQPIVTGNTLGNPCAA